MTTRMSVVVKNGLLTAMLTNSAVGFTMLFHPRLLTGAMPASPETAESGTLLNGSPTSMSGYQEPSNGTCVLNANVSQTPTVTNTAGYCRWLNTNGVAGLDVDVGVASSGAGMILSTLSLTSGVAVQITNASINMPANLGTIYLNTSLRNKIARCLAIASANIGIGYNGSILVYDGSIPASANDAATGTLLATFSTGTSGWGTPSSGSAALSAPLVVNASNSGTATYARLVKGSDVLQGTIGTAGTDFTIDSVSLVSGNPTTITNATIAF